MPAKKSASKKTLRAAKAALPNWMTEVTPFSKALAMTVFIFLPFVSFWFGMRFQHQMLKDLFQSSQVVIRKGCSSPEQWMDEKKRMMDDAEDDRMGQMPTPQPSPRPRT